MTEQGPGWGMMWIWQPWRADGDNDVNIYGQVYATFEEARAAALDSGPMHTLAARDQEPSAVSLLRSCHSGKNMLINYERNKDAFAIYRVRDGQSSHDAGMDFYLHWRETLIVGLMPEILDRHYPGASVWYGWNPRPAASAAPMASDGGGVPCLLVMLGLLLGLLLLGWAVG